MQPRYHKFDHVNVSSVQVSKGNQMAATEITTNIIKKFIISILILHVYHLYYLLISWVANYVYNCEFDTFIVVTNFMPSVTMAILQF